MCWCLKVVWGCLSFSVGLAANVCVPRGVEAVCTAIHLECEKKLPGFWGRHCSCLFCCVGTRSVPLMGQAGLRFSLRFLCSTCKHPVAALHSICTAWPDRGVQWGWLRGTVLHAGLQQPAGITAEASGTSGGTNSTGGAALVRVSFRVTGRSSLSLPSRFAWSL